MNRKDARRRITDRRLGTGGIQSQRGGVHVDEDRIRVLEQETVGGGDEAQRRRHHLVPRPPPKLPHRQVERRRAAGDGDGILDTEPVGEGPLEALEHRPE